MKKILKNGTIVLEEGIYNGDLLIEGEKIAAIEDDIKDSSAKVIDARNRYIIPGGVDVHTHLELNTGVHIAKDDFYTGTLAAALGGTTTIVDHPGFGPENCSLKYQITEYYKKAKDKAIIDYSFHGVLQHVNDAILDEIPQLIDEGIVSFKGYLTYKYPLDEIDILRIMEVLKEHGGVIAIHCENDKIIKYYLEKFEKAGKLSPKYHAYSRNDVCEADAVNRMISIARYAKNAILYIVHLSSSLSLDYVKLAHRDGIPVIAETCPQYLLLDIDLYDRDDGLKYILTPPLRDKHNQHALWEGLRDGAISVVATDHCPFDYKLREKVAKRDFRKCPNGLPGIETRIPILFSEGFMKGRISLERFVEVCCTNPAKMMGLYPRKGVIKIGSDADIVIIDPNKRLVLNNKILHQNVDYTPFEGLEIEGYPVLTISRGEIICVDGKFIGKKGRGKFIRRYPVSIESADY